MILTAEQIKDIIINNPNKDLINKAKRRNKNLRMHMYGEDLSVNMPKVDGIEQEMLHELRVKYAKSNKDLFSRLSRYTDQIFTANGGSTYYNLSDAQNKRAAMAVSNVRDGVSAKRWADNYWKPHYLDDPSGMIFMEIGNGSEYPAGKVYPTYKGISTVYDYKPRGVKLDYVVFYVSEEEKARHGIKRTDKVFRVVDDAFDYYVKQKSNTEIEVLQDKTYPNYFMFVPAILNSDIVDPNNDGCMLSIFDDAIELANQYLLKGSIKLTHDFLHGFPKYWEYVDKCEKCGGTGKHSGQECSECHGSGNAMMIRIDRAKALKYPENADATVVTPNIAGYVSPDRTYHEIATADIADLENLMHFTLWNTQSNVKTSGPATTGAAGQPKTATEIAYDAQPIAARLTRISETASKRVKFIVDCIITLELQQANYIASGGSSISLGTRFVLESPDAVWKRYVDSKNSKAPVSVLNDLLTEYIDTKYKDDPVGYEIATKLAIVEPFVHNTVQEVQGMNTDPKDYQSKLYFSEWLARQEDGYLFITDVERMREDLDAYASAKVLPTPEPVVV